MALMKETLEVNFKALKDSNTAPWALNSFKSLTTEIIESCQRQEVCAFKLDIAKIEEALWTTIAPYNSQSALSPKNPVEEGHHKFMEAKSQRLKGKIKEAIDLAKEAEALGNISAIMLLGSIYECNLHDFNQAYKSYKRAAELGAPLGLAMVGTCYYDGMGVEQDKGKAYQFFLEAERKDLVLLNNYWLGNLYRDGVSGVVEKNKEFARACYTQLRSLDWAVKYGKEKLKSNL